MITRGCSRRCGQPEFDAQANSGVSYGAGDEALAARVKLGSNHLWPEELFPSEEKSTHKMLLASSKDTSTTKGSEHLEKQETKAPLSDGEKLCELQFFCTTFFINLHPLQIEQGEIRKTVKGETR